MKILLVEDDLIVAFDMQTLLQEYGAEVLGPAHSVDEGQKISARTRPDVAVLDVNLNGEFVFALAEQLRQRAVPFLFATAYADDEGIFPDVEKHTLRVAKPVLPALLVAQIRRLVGR